MMLQRAGFLRWVITALFACLTCAVALATSQSRARRPWTAPKTAWGDLT
jgi:hypothetical protein